MQRLLCLGLLLFCATTTQAAEPDKLLHEKCLYPTVRIRPDGAEHAHGTGVVVRSERVREGIYRNVVLTCAHVVDWTTQYVADVAEYHDWSHFDRWKNYPTQLYARNRLIDLAVLVFESERAVPTADLGLEERLYFGDEVFKFGCGAAGTGHSHPRMDVGRITGLSDHPRMTAYTVMGDSGGPVYRNHKLVGVTASIRTGSYRGGPVLFFGVSFFSPVSALKTWDVEEKNSLGFIYKAGRRLPELPFHMMALSQHELLNMPRPPEDGE